MKVPSLSSFLRTVGSSGLILLALPASTNYQLDGYSFGSGGASNATSTNYAANAVTGEQEGDGAAGAMKLFGGLIHIQEANVPDAPTFDNPRDYYKKLHFAVNPSGNPSDTKFAIAISTDNFATTQFIQNDNTVGATLGLEDYQTYASWGGAAGQTVNGLKSNTTYYIKVKAMQGKFTETEYGPVASATTSPAKLDFAIRTDSQTNPPFTITFNDLTAGSILDSPDKIWTDFSTNADMGGQVYVSNDSAGLRSSVQSYTIAGVSADLSGRAEGYGAQAVSVTQTSGGPLVVATPYDAVGSAVGILDTTVRQIFSSDAPIVGGSGSFLLKAKSSSVTPASTDYKSVLTLIASGNF